MPILASGIGPVSDLKRRLRMIMSGTTPRSLTWGGLLAMLIVGGFALPLAPTWGQDRAPRETTPPDRKAEKPNSTRAGASPATVIAPMTCGMNVPRSPHAPLHSKRKRRFGGVAESSTISFKYHGLAIRILSGYSRKSGIQQMEKYLNVKSVWIRTA